MTRLRGFNILPEQAQDWEDDEIEGYLRDLEQQGRLSGRDRAIQLLAEQGRGPGAQQPEPDELEAKPKRRTRKAADEEAE